MENDLKLYRKRFIPDETVFLKDDIIIYKDDDVIITKWRVLKPRNDFSNGISCYLLKKGFKISKFYKDNGELLYWYCDIIKYKREENSYIFIDLLADVIIYPNGNVKVVDIGEIAQALSNGIIDQSTACEALEKLDILLGEIYSGGLEALAVKLIETEVKYNE